MNDSRAGQLARARPTSSTSPTWSRRTTPGSRTPARSRNGSPSAPRGTAGAASTPPSTRRTSWRPRRRSATTAAAGVRRPAFIGRDTHGLSEPAWATALEVLVANEVTVLVDDRDRYTPTPAVSHAILRANQGKAAGASGLADGIVVTPSHNPPRDGGFKYNPPHGGPADSDATGWIADAANDYIEAGLTGVQRVPFWRARGARRATTSWAPTSTTSATCSTSTPSDAGVRIGADPLGGASVDYWGEIAERLTARPHRGQPARRPDLALHDPRLGRQDPHGLLVTLGDGVAHRTQGRVPGRHGQRRRLRPPRDRHPRRRADEPQPLPRGRDQLPVRRCATRLAATPPRSARRWSRPR